MFIFGELYLPSMGRKGPEPRIRDEFVTALILDCDYFMIEPSRLPFSL
jgi:hypothetical protein